MSIRDRINKWEQKSHEPSLRSSFQELRRDPDGREDQVSLRRIKSMPPKNRPEHDALKRVKTDNVRLSVIFESDTEEEDDENNGSEDVEDAPLEMALDLAEIEAEFLSIELAQEALQDILQSLEAKGKENRKSMELAKERRRSLDIAGAPPSPLEEKGETIAKFISAEEDAIKVIEDKGTQSEANIITKEEKEESEEVNEQITSPKKEGKEETTSNEPITSPREKEKKDECYREILDEVVEMARNSIDENIREKVPAKVERALSMIEEAPKISPPPPLPPPPPPPPPPKPSSPIRAIKVQRQEGRNEVELRVKNNPKVDLVNQLKKAFTKRGNRASLKLKYEKMDSSDKH